MAGHYTGNDFRHPFPPVKEEIQYIKAERTEEPEQKKRERKENASPNKKTFAYSADRAKGKASLSSGEAAYSALFSLDELEEKEEPLGSAPALPFEPPVPLRKLDRSFGETLADLIREKGMTNVEFYNKANISRQLFNRIIKQTDRPPKKHIALACAVALQLDLDQTKALLEKAGYALSHADLTDVIVEAFIANHCYDVFAINDYLYEYDRGMLGSGMD